MKYFLDSTGAVHAFELDADPSYYEGMRSIPEDEAWSIAKGVEQTLIPAVCTPSQGLVALFSLKRITEDNILAAIESIPDDVLRYTAKIGYQRATSWERASPTMQTMAQLLQLTEADLDSLFAHAATVQI